LKKIKARKLAVGREIKRMGVDTKTVEGNQKLKWKRVKNGNENVTVTWLKYLINNSLFTQLETQNSWLRSFHEFCHVTKNWAALHRTHTSPVKPAHTY
jgi:hypothetical protein